MLKRLLGLLLLLVVAAVVGGIYWFNNFRDGMIAQVFANMKPAPVAISTMTVEPVSWTPGIETIGTVGAASGVDLTVQTTGVIKQVNFSANQRIAQGKLMVQLDDEVEAANLEAAKTQLALNKRALDRAQQLQRSGAGTQSSLDTARAAAETSQTDVDRLQAVLDQKRLVAPFEGIAGIPRVEVGQFIQPGTVVVTLQNMDTMRADFSVPEQDLGSISMSQAVTFRLDGTGEPFVGKITGIDPKVDASSRLVSVRAVISNPNGRLSPGQFVQVRVEMPKEDNVIAVPDTALVSSLYGDYIYVVVPKPAEPASAADAKPAADAEKKPEAAKPADAAKTPAEADKAKEPELIVRQIFVQVGRRSNGLVEIKSNLKSGDQLVTAGQNKLSNNAAVVVDNTVTPKATEGSAAK